MLPFEKHETEFEGLIINKYSATGTFISAIKGWKAKGESTELFEGEEAHGLTVNALGELLVYYEEGVVEFDNAEKNNFLRGFESEAARETGSREGIAEDAAGDLYFGVSALESDPTSPTVVAKDAFLEGEEETTTLIGALDPVNTTGFAVDPKTQNLFLDNVKSVAMVTANGELLQRFGNEEGEGKEAILGRGAGLADAPRRRRTEIERRARSRRGKGRHRRVRARTAQARRASTNSARGARPRPRPNSAARSTRTAKPANTSSATAREPSGRGGLAGRSPCVEGSAGSAGQGRGRRSYGDGRHAGSTEDRRPVKPFTVYRYRLIAHNAKGLVESAEQKVRTLPAAPGELLPDHRGWSVASTADKNGGFLEGIRREGGAIEAAPDGSGMAYISTTAPPGAEGNNAPEETQILSSRHANGGGQRMDDCETPRWRPRVQRRDSRPEQASSRPTCRWRSSRRTGRIAGRTPELSKKRANAPCTRATMRPVPPRRKPPASRARQRQNVTENTKA